MLLPDDLRDLAPSAKLVYLTLRLHGPATPRELRERTGLAKSTVHEATRDLQRRGAVEHRIAPHDPTTMMYDTHQEEQGE